MYKQHVLSTPMTHCLCLSDAGEDFTIPLDLDLNFPVGVGNGASDCLNIQILEDFDFEGDHSFFVDIMSISPPTVGLADIAGQAVVNIMDDDGTYSHTCRRFRICILHVQCTYTNGGYLSDSLI